MLSHLVAPTRQSLCSGTIEKCHRIIERSELLDTCPTQWDTLDCMTRTHTIYENLTDFVKLEKKIAAITNNGADNTDNLCERVFSLYSRCDVNIFDQLVTILRNIAGDEVLSLPSHLLQKVQSAERSLSGHIERVTTLSDAIETLSRHNSKFYASAGETRVRTPGRVLGLAKSLAMKSLWYIGEMFAEVVALERFIEINVMCDRRGCGELVYVRV